MNNIFENKLTSLNISSWMVCHRPYSAGSTATDKSKSDSHSERSVAVSQTTPPASTKAA